MLFSGAIHSIIPLAPLWKLFFDRIVIAMAPTSSAPAWFYGIFLILLFAALLGWLPFGGMIDAPPPQGALARALSIAKHMILPLLALVISSIFFLLLTLGGRSF